MHEASLIEHLLEQVQSVVDQQRALRVDPSNQEQSPQVKRIQLEVGALAGVEPDLLMLAFNRLAPLAGLGEACLELIPVPLVVCCRECGQESEPIRNVFRCGNCASSAVSIVRGDTCVLAQIELETEQAEP